MSRRILLIEDNAHNRYLATFLLERECWQVKPAEHGLIGLELTSRWAPALILLDIQLPGMDGVEVARCLRADPRSDAVPIIAVTSFAMAGDADRCIAAGCNGYIEKPINPETFAQEVASFLTGDDE